MSGLIAGAINIEKNLLYSIKKRTIDIFNTYKIDKLGILDEDNIYMICGQQYIKNEDRFEKIPYYDKNLNLIINGDIILDNRNELLNLLNVPQENRNSISDTELILKAYQKWMYDCPKYLIGDFSFVIFNKNNNEIFCARDHMGCRPFYYYKSDKAFAFSTISNPLIPLTDMTLNERWITDFLAILGPLNNSEAEETVYNGIFQLQPANIMIIRNNEIIKKKYWDPLNEVKPLKLKSHNDYVKEFLKVFDEAVTCRLNTSYNVGIMVSGGLDSGSVAAIASKKLKTQGKVLNGYSFVPMQGYAEKYKSYRMVDESNYVNLLKDYCGNMNVTFCRNDGMNSLSNIDELIEIYEQPIKTLENSYWMTGIVKECSKKNIKILLSGQFGNGTISFGDFFIYMDTLLNKFKIKEIIDEVNCASKKYKASKKEIYKRILKNKIPYKFKKIYYRKELKNEDRFEFNPVNMNLVKKWNVEKRFDEREYNMIIDNFTNISEYRSKMLNDTGLSHISIMETKDSLKYGVIHRDPTKDKRIIEFCLSIPMSEYVHKGEERYLIRSAMKGLLPEEIRTNWKHRGLQSADWVDRLIPVWDSIHSEIEESLNDPEMQKYMNISKLEHFLSKYKDISNMESDPQEVKCLLISLVFYKFLLQHRKMLEENRQQDENVILL